MYAYYADSSALVSAGTSASEEIVQVFPARQPKKPINYSKKVSAEENIDLFNLNVQRRRCFASPVIMQ